MFKIGIVYPHYSGQIHIGSARMLYRVAVGRTDYSVAFIADTGSSLLPHSFNMLLCMALNARDEGNCTHMAMLHCDIAPQPEWLDILVAEMRRTGVDLISTVVPIKDQQADPRTSTAVFDTDNPWEPKRYILLSDREKMPLTFTPADVCKPGEILGINTGCFLADLRCKWWDNFAFDFKARIVKTEGEGWKPFIRPEDWELSRWLADHGAKYAATWKPQVTHFGEAGWSNR